MFKNTTSAKNVAPTSHVHLVAI